MGTDCIEVCNSSIGAGGGGLFSGGEQSQEIAGRKKFRETRHPVYCRVRRRDSDKWVREGFVEWKNDERVSDES